MVYDGSWATVYIWFHANNNYVLEEIVFQRKVRVSYKDLLLYNCETWNFPDTMAHSLMGYISVS